MMKVPLADHTIEMAPWLTWRLPHDGSRHPDDPRSGWPIRRDRRRHIRCTGSGWTRAV